MSYFVVGGLYKNTSFNEFVDDSKKERYGPFESYEDAKKYWDKIIPNEVPSKLKIFKMSLSND